MTDKIIKSNTIKPTKRSSGVRGPTVSPNTASPSSHSVRQPPHRHHPYATSNISQQDDRCRRSTSKIVKPAQKVVRRETEMPTKVSAPSTSYHHKSLPPPPKPPSLLARVRLASPPPPMAQQQQQRRSPLVHSRVRQLRLPDEGLGRSKRSKTRSAFKQQKQDRQLKQSLAKYKCTGETMAQLKHRLWLEFDLPPGPLKAPDPVSAAKERKRYADTTASHVASVERLQLEVERLAAEYRRIMERYERNHAGKKPEGKKRDREEGPDKSKKRK